MESEKILKPLPEPITKEALRAIKWARSIDSGASDTIIEMRARHYLAGQLEALQLFVDSLKEWCGEIPGREWGNNQNTGSVACANELLAFAVQRLELIKQGE